MGKIIKFKDKYPSAISVFSKWAEKGKDEGMEKGHAKSVEFMFEKLEPFFKDTFSAIDVGCGNGWVVRKFKELNSCILAVGVDGANQMIEKAKTKDSCNNYFCADINHWKPIQKFDIIHSMEVLYYLEQPLNFLNRVYSEWLNKKGQLIFGIDHYLENKPSLSWPEECGVNMNTQPKQFWLDIMKKIGFKNIQSWQIGKRDNWEGTFVVLGEK